MEARSKKIRTFALVSAAGWLIAMSLACGGGGDDESSEEGTASAATAEPAAPADPFQAVGATMEQLGEQLERIAEQNPAAFQNPSSIADNTAHLSSGSVHSAGNPDEITLRLRYSPGLGQNARPVYAVLHRFSDGRVRMQQLEAQNPAAGRPVYTAPDAIAAVAQTLRLRVMDGACDLPTMNDAELREAFGSLEFLQRPAREVATNCPAAREAFNATSLSLSSVSVSVGYPSRPGYGVLTSLRADVASSAQLRFTETQFSYAR
ncbi:MAG: hypothetical protein H6719_15970 [Sandaracinaceae bacterium]|nr:hypothetical protein [Sandaracinaceae bacterium]